MNVVFFDENRADFLPLVFTKPISKLRVGIMTIEEKWMDYLGEKEISVSYLTEKYLSTKYPLKLENENIFINARFCPDARIANFILNNLNSNEAVYYKYSIIVAKCSIEQFENSSYDIKDYNKDFIGIELTKVSDLFSKNSIAIELDYARITDKRSSAKISSTNTVIGDNIFIEEGAKIEAAIINSIDGPVYIGKNAEVMEGSIIRGPFSLCDHGVLKLGTKIYGPTTVGKFSKVGGEVNNSVIQDFSNKGHDGFLGNSVIGEWCNLGADTNTSNLKNNYSEVKSWSYNEANYKNTGLQFCGLIMGDHSKCGINTMFNTGSVVGVNSNIYGGDFPPKFIPSYSWGGAKGFVTYNLEKSFEVAQKIMERRAVELTVEDKKILTAIFDITAKFRK